MSTLDVIAGKIIKEQELVIGPLAWSEARKVQGLAVTDTATGTVTVDNANPAVVDKLVERYERLFGRASHEVCRDAARALLAQLSPAEIPSSLR